MIGLWVRLSQLPPELEQPYWECGPDWALASGSPCVGLSLAVRCRYEQVTATCLAPVGLAIVSQAPVCGVC